MTPTATNIRPDQKSRSLLIFTAPRCFALKRQILGSGPGGPCLVYTERTRCAALLLPGRRRAQDFVECGQAFGDLHRTGQAQWAQAVLQRLLPELAFVADRLDRAARRIADGEELEQAGAAAKAGHPALEAADRLVGANAAVQPPRLDDLVQRLACHLLVGLLARRTERSHQALREHADQRRADQVGRDAERV